MSAHVWDMADPKNALLAKAEECRKILRNARENIRVERVPEAMDRSLYATEREVSAERMETCSRLLRQVEAALTRLNGSRYGLCMKCENAIELKRLTALPWALFCARCQQGVDLLHHRARSCRNAIVQAA
jgi:DnaK suppressor protein